MLGISAAIHALAIPWATGLLEFDGAPARRVRVSIQPNGDTRTVKVSTRGARSHERPTRDPEGAQAPRVVHVNSFKSAPKSQAQAPSPPPVARRAPPSARLPKAGPQTPTLLRTLRETNKENPSLTTHVARLTDTKKPVSASHRSAANSTVAPRLLPHLSPEERIRERAGEPSLSRVSRNRQSPSPASTTGASDPPKLRSSNVRKSPDARGRVGLPLRLRVLNRTLPPYPPEARKHGQEGIVLLRLEVLPDGRVGKIQVAKSSGFDLLDRAAVRSASTWRFAFDGQKSTEGAWAQVPIRFQIVQP